MDTNTKNIIYFNQFEHYPSLIKNGWKDFVLNKIENSKKNHSLIKLNDGISILYVEVVESLWDYNHFGFKISKISNPILINNVTIEMMRQSIQQIIDESINKDVKLITARVNGDNLNYIHELEDFGFKYYETIIWPIANLNKMVIDDSELSEVKFFDPIIDNLDDVKSIAIKDQYQKGHYHCDTKMDLHKVNSLYANWVQSAFDSNKKIAIVKIESKIAGYFICDIDDELNKYLGFKYGRLQSLALDSNFRGSGLGKKLFVGTLNLLKNHGCNYVDSGYASKNHLSAKLHNLFSFNSVYEEITMHKWLL